MADLLNVLKSLDPLDDTAWTDDGLPALDAVKAITGDAKITRKSINDVALGLTRSNVGEYIAPPVKESKVASSDDGIVPQDNVKAELDKALAAIEEARNRASTTEAELAELQRKVTELDAQIEKPTANQEFADAMTHYIAATAKERMERAEKVAKLEALGLSFDDLKELFPQLGMR